MNTIKYTKPFFLKIAVLMMFVLSIVDAKLWGQACTTYSVDQAKICSAIDGQNATCAQEASLFSPGVDVPQTLIFLSRVNGTMAIRFVWYRPDGTEYARQTTGTFVGNCGSYWFTYNVGAIPASERNMGTWRVDFQLSHNGAAFQTVASPTFEVGCYCTLEYPPRLVCTQDGRIMTACDASCAGIPISSSFNNCCDLTDVDATFAPTSCNSNTGNLTVRWNRSIFEDYGYSYNVLVRNVFNNTTYSTTTTNNSFLFPLMPVGTYNIEVSINGCKGQTQISAELSQLSLSTNPSNPSCGFNNGNITTTVSGGTAPYRYVWSNGSTNANLANLPAGTFSLTVTDQRGCTATQSNPLRYTIATPAAVSVNNITASGANISWTNLSGISTYRIEYRRLSTSAWSSVTTGSSPQTLTGLNANTDYEVRLTGLCGADPGNPSSITRFKTLSIPCVLDFSFSSSAPTCDQTNGSITVSVSSGVAPYLYAWNNGASTATVNNLRAGTYQVTVTDNQGCPLSKSFTLSNVVLNPTQINVSNITQTSATLVWNATSSSYRLEYKLTSASSWTGLNVSTNLFTLTGLSPNSSYQVRVFGVCNAQVSINSGNTSFNTLATQAPVVKITAPANNTQFRAPADIAVTAEATDPDSPIEKVEFYRNNVLITTDNTAPYATSMPGLAAGTYTFEARAYDPQQNRGVSTPISVQVLPACTLDFSLAASATTCGLNNGKIEITNLLGLSPFIYRWNTGSTSNSIQNLAPGTYQLSITDANNCQVVKTSLVPGSVKPVPNLNYDISSKGLEIKITNNSTNLEKWSWDFGDGSTSVQLAPSHLYAKAGTYSITGFAENACEKINFLPRTVTVAALIEDKDKLSLQLGTVSLEPGGEALLPIHVRNFKEVIGVQFTLKVARPGASILGVSPSPSFKQLSFLKINAQTYSFIWLPDPPQLFSFADSTKMLDLKLKLDANFPVDSCVSITFEGTPTDLIAFQQIKGVETEVVPLTKAGQICAQRVLTGTVNGKITWKNNRTFANVPVLLSAQQNWSAYTNSEGVFRFPLVPLLGMYTLRPHYDQEHLNGVNISDVLALRQHILGTKRISDPALLIAADVNGTKSLNLLDLVAMMRVILGENDSFPDQHSWRFVANSYLLDSQKKWTDLPFDYPFKLDSVVVNVPFTAIKMGDITQSATLRADLPVVGFKMEDRFFEHGQVLELPISFTDAVQAWQLDLGFDPSILAFQGIENRDNNLEIKHHLTPDGRLSLVAYSKAPVATSIFSLKLVFKTLGKGGIRQSLHLLKDRITPLALLDFQENALELLFTNDPKAKEHKKTLSWHSEVVPNPAQHAAQLNITAPETNKGVMRVFDMGGKLINTWKVDLLPGLNNLEITDLNQWNSGLYLYQIQLEDLVLNGKFVLEK